MNCLSQLENGIFATEQSLAELAKKESAKILVYSDSHGNGTVVRDIFEEFGAQCDAAVFAGDGIYDLLALFENARKYEELMKFLPPVIAAVRGNNDYAFGEYGSAQKTFISRHVILTVGQKRILVTHGNEEGVYYSTAGLESTAEINGANAVIYGHTHFPAENNHLIYSMNPGSCSHPRHNSRPSCAVLEIRGKTILSIFYKIETGLKSRFTPFFPESYC